MSPDSEKTGSYSDIGSLTASSAITTSSRFASISFAICSIVGSFECSLVSFSLACIALYARSRIERLTRIEPESRKYRRSSPIIIGTAYVLNLTLKSGQKLSIAFISPIQPTWNRSSAFSPLPENRCITLSTRRRLPFISSSLALGSPSRIFCRSSIFSDSLSTFNFAVLTPLISTLL